MRTRPKPQTDVNLRALPPERQAEIAELLHNKSLATVRKALRAEGIEVSSTALADFQSWWQLHQQFKNLESDAVTLQQLLRQEMPGLSEDQIVRYATQYFNILAIKMEDAKLFLALQSASRRARLDAEQIALKREQLALSHQKFQRDTCQLFLKWFANEQAHAIASSVDDNPAKIEKLGQLMFGEDWK